MAKSRSNKNSASVPIDEGTVAFISLGCPKNLVDSEKMLGLLVEDGLTPVAYELAEQGERVDAVVINTCGFLEASKDESLSVIQDAIKLKATGQIGRVVVTGCLVQRHRAKMLEWAPGIDAMIGVFDRDRIVTAVRGGDARAQAAGIAADKPTYWIAANAIIAAEDRGMATTGLTVNGKDGKGIGYFEDDRTRLRLTPRHYAYLRVSEGCNQNCAFCTIPSIRGKMRSKPLATIREEAKELIADGCFELHLIGQDTTSYGDDIGIGLAQMPRDAAGKTTGGLPRMLQAVSQAYDELGIRDGWIRLMYAYPTNFTDECIEAIATTPRVLPYIDIPLQHASTRILQLMKRNTTRQQQEELMAKLRARIPGMTIRTTFISGFPGETEADHQELLEFVAQQKFNAVGVFEYSYEPGTVAGNLELDTALAVPADVKARRKGEVMALQQQIAFARQAALAARFDEKNPSAAGERVDVLIDRPLRASGRATHGVGKGGQLYEGRTGGQAPDIDAITFVQSRRKLAPGELVPCIIVGSDGYDLIAKPQDEIIKNIELNVLRR